MVATHKWKVRDFAGGNKEASVSSLYSGGGGVGGVGGIQTFSCSTELKTCPAGLF